MGPARNGERAGTTAEGRGRPAARGRAGSIARFFTAVLLVPGPVDLVRKTADRSRLPVAPPALHREAVPALQGPRLDVGSFTLYVNGERAGREQFSLQSITSADGGAYELRAESAMGDRRSAVRLETDSAGTPVRYAVEERAGATVALRLGGQRVRGRFATLARSTRGEAAREYILSPGAIVLEQDGVHQYAMLVRARRMARGDTATIPTLTPVENRQGAVRLVLVSESDTVTIAGSRRDARCWRVLAANGETRTVWADAQGRVLRLRIPSRGFEAVRDDVPR